MIRVRTKCGGIIADNHKKINSWSKKIIGQNCSVFCEFCVKIRVECLPYVQRRCIFNLYGTPIINGTPFLLQSARRCAGGGDGSGLEGTVESVGRYNGKSLHQHFSVLVFQHFGVSLFQHFNLLHFRYSDVTSLRLYVFPLLQHYVFSWFSYFSVSVFPLFLLLCFRCFGFSSFPYFDILSFPYSFFPFFRCFVFVYFLLFVFSFLFRSVFVLFCYYCYFEISEFRINDNII